MNHVNQTYLNQRESVLKIFAFWIVFALISFTANYARYLPLTMPLQIQTVQQQQSRKIKNGWVKMLTTRQDAATITAKLEPSEVSPGDKAQLKISITPSSKEWYFYENQFRWMRRRSASGLPVVIHVEKKIGDLDIHEASRKSAAAHSETGHTGKTVRKRTKSRSTFHIQCHGPKDAKANNRSLYRDWLAFNFTVRKPDRALRPEAAGFAVDT